MDGSSSDEIVFTSKDIHNTKPLVGQEWCAYTYNLSKVPSNNIYGLFKVICTGTTEAGVKETVIKMLDDQKLERYLPFVKYCETGLYKLLIGGGSDPKADKEVYNTTTKKVVGELEHAVTEKRKAAAKELQESEARLRKESEDTLEDDPYSFETYCAYRGTLQTATTRIRQLEGEITHIKSVKNKSSIKVKEISRKHGNYNLKYKTQFKAMDDEALALSNADE